MRLLVSGAGALVALAAFTACGGETKTAETTPNRGETPSPSVAVMPQSATFTAELAGEQDKPPMALAVTVAGEKVVGYACNGVNDEAWFFGTQKDGVMSLTSKYQDTLRASYDGTKLNGTLTMDDVEYTGAATPAAADPGIYTATAGDSRANWVVLSAQKMVGILQPNSKRDREVIDQINAQQADFRGKVRQARLDRQLQQAPQLTFGTWSTNLNGTAVTAVRVTGDMTSPPSSS